MAFRDPLTYAPVREAVERLATLGLNRQVMAEAMEWVCANAHHAAPSAKRGLPRAIDMGASLVMHGAQARSVIPDWFDIGWAQCLTVETADAHWYVRDGAQELPVTAWAVMRTAAVIVREQLAVKARARYAADPETARLHHSIHSAKARLRHQRGKLVELERKHADELQRWAFAYKFDAIREDISRTEATLRKLQTGVSQ